MGSSDAFAVAVRVVDGRSVVQLGGQLDVLAVPTLRTTFDALRGVGETELAIDLGQVEFIDSSAIGVIAEMVRSGAWVTIVDASEFAQRVLDLTGITSLCTDSARLAAG